MRKKGNKRIGKASLFGIVATITALSMCTVSQASITDVCGIGNQNTILGGRGCIGNVTGIGNQNTIYVNSMAEAYATAGQIGDITGIYNQNTIVCATPEIYNYMSQNVSIRDITGIGNQNVIVLATQSQPAQPQPVQPQQNQPEVVTPTPTPQPVTPQPEGSVPSGETPVTQQPEVSVPSGETPVTQQPEVKKPEEKTPTDKDKTDLDNVPKTGDTSNITLVVGLMAASLVAMITLIIVRKKNKHRV